MSNKSIETDHRKKYYTEILPQKTTPYSLVIWHHIQIVLFEWKLISSNYISLLKSIILTKKINGTNSIPRDSNDALLQIVRWKVF